MRSNREVVLRTVSTDGTALEDASYGLRADREVVLTAVLNDDLTIRSALEELQVDPDIVLTALLSWSNDERFFCPPSCNDVVVINDGDVGDDSYSSMEGGGKMMMMDGLILVMFIEIQNVPST